MNKPIIWSFGGGTQSVAIGVLIARGSLPMPEKIVMADTGREATETWNYLRDVVQPCLGLQVEIAPHSLATVDLYAATGKILLPVYQRPAGRLQTYCSNEWKKRVVFRWLRKYGYGPRTPVTLWLGISLDELHRAKPSGKQWVENAWPLLYDVPLRREECLKLVLDAGLPRPPRSSCWMCPHRTTSEWRYLREYYPEDWKAAITLEQSIQKQNPNMYLYHRRERLDLASLGDEQENLFEDCDGGYCFV